ncbi:hypothetical protein CAL7716_059690 [Calothrix sp. PCC 7716]|nr:hypothetical protein CAL7716_059690 [Calothrix sp. PCC 7716]
MYKQIRLIRTGAFYLNLFTNSNTRFETGANKFFKKQLHKFAVSRNTDKYKLCGSFLLGASRK